MKEKRKNDDLDAALASAPSVAFCIMQIYRDKDHLTRGRRSARPNELKRATKRAGGWTDVKEGDPPKSGSRASGRGRGRKMERQKMDDQRKLS